MEVGSATIFTIGHVPVPVLWLVVFGGRPPCSR